MMTHHEVGQPTNPVSTFGRDVVTTILADALIPFASDEQLVQALHLVLQHAPCAFAVTTGPAHILVYGNTAFHDLVGAPSIGPTAVIADVLLPEAATPLQPLLDRAWLSAEVSHDRFRAQENEYWDCTVWPFGTVPRVARGLVIEIRKSAVLGEQVELSTLSNVRFVGNISHELRAPLDVVLAQAELIAAEIHAPLTGTQDGDLARIHLNQQHLLSLINELFIAVRSGTSESNKISEVFAHQAVAGAVALIEKALTRKSIRYEHDAQDAEVVALGNPERIRQILLNLLANAVKFTPRGGQITTRCEAFGDQVCISVIDDGIGIAASRLDAIFEPLFQADSAQPMYALGLGLAISRELARSMRGDLTVESRLGGLTCFTLTLLRSRQSTKNNAVTMAMA